MVFLPPDPPICHPSQQQHHLPQNGPVFPLRPREHSRGEPSLGSNGGYRSNDIFQLPLDQKTVSGLGHSVLYLDLRHY